MKFTNGYHQLSLMRKLEVALNAYSVSSLVYYCAPAFQSDVEMLQAKRNFEIWEQSYACRPGEVPETGTTHHLVRMCDTGHILMCSEPISLDPAAHLRELDDVVARRTSTRAREWKHLGSDSEEIFGRARRDLSREEREELERDPGEGRIDGLRWAHRRIPPPVAIVNHVLREAVSEFEHGSEIIEMVEAVVAGEGTEGSPDPYVDTVAFAIVLAGAFGITLGYTGRTHVS